jgi:hypothetical protein
MSSDSAKSYGNHLIPSERVLLEDWSIHVRRVWGTPYLVGSALTRRDFRDVDVRVILAEDEWAGLFPGLDDVDQRHPKWSGICTAFSLWGQRATGLPIDFQLQPMGKANEQHQGRRHALGLGYYGFEIEPR